MLKNMNRLKGTILICEPHKGLRESFKLILEGEYQLFFANNLEEVFDSLNLKKINLFILNADDSSKALEFTASVKQTYPDLKILLITTNLELEFQESAIKLATGIRFHEKPWDSSELKEQIDTIIRGYALEKHTYIVKIKLT